MCHSAPPQALFLPRSLHDLRAPREEQAAEFRNSLWMGQRVAFSPAMLNGGNGPSPILLPNVNNWLNRHDR
jgi:hypothetical protein